MRLTLRNLLNYMDGVLEPKDAELIGKKVQESDFASGLLQRIRDVTQRLRVAGPEASERGPGMDPNTIAEYLDNALPSSRVPDFEKVCLESDAHLAEVASCHQILTLVLGEPAEVSPESRLRMYRLPKEAVAESEISAAVEETASEDRPAEQRNGEVAPPPRGKHVPEYLRETPRRQRAWLVATLFLAAGLGVVALSASGQFKPGTLLGDLLPRRVASLESALPGVAGADGIAVPGTAKVDAASERADVVSGAVVVPPIQPAVASHQPEIRQPVHPAASQPVSPGPPAPLPRDSAESVAMPAAPSGPPATEPAMPSPDELEPPTPSAATAEEMPPASEVPAETEPSPDQPAIEAPPAEPAMAEQPATGPPISRDPIGEYVSTTEVLVKLDAESRWHRVAAQAVLSAGDEILSFPTYRPAFNLAGEVGVQLFDGTRLVLLGPDSEGVPGLDIRYGRLVVRGGGAKDARLRLKFGPRTGVVRFADAESIAMIEVGRPKVSGVDPQTQPSPLVVDLYVTSGAVAWQQDAGGEPVSLNAPMKLRLDDNPLQPVDFQELPGWSSPDTVSLLDQRASAAVGPSLEADRRIELALRELTGHRQKEVRWLAMRCLGHLGDFEPMVKALDDPEQKPVWQDYIDELCIAITRGPQAAARIQAGMERLFGDNGTILYELLWKHRKPELTKDDSTRLVNLLDHNVLAVRVLSFWNLREATSLGLYYRPEYPAAKRLPSVQKWRERMGVSLILPSGVVSGGLDRGVDGGVSSPVLVEDDQD